MDWFEGWDHYNVLADTNNGSWTTNAGGLSAIVTSPVRTGPKALRIRNDVNTTYEQTKLFPDANVYYCGMAIYNEELAASFRRGGWKHTNGNFSGFNINSSGVMEVLYNNVVIWTDTSQKVFIGSYSYHEIGINVVLGEVIYRFNGNTVVTLSGLAAATQLRTLAIQLGPNTTADRTFYVDDVYANDHGFLGAQRCWTLFPASDETPQNWVYSGGASGFTLINDVPYNLANYVEGVNIGDKAQFGLTDIVANNAIVNGVRLSSVMALDVAGSGSAKHSLLKSDETVIFAGNDHALSTSAIYYNDSTNLVGVSVADINAGAIELEKTA